MSEVSIYKYKRGSAHYRWKGGRSICNGYVKLFIPDHPRSNRDGYVLEHVLIAQAALGKCLPVGVEIHHVDCNRSNNANSNLVICQDSTYHKLLHRRMRVQAAGGNPNIHKLCGCCKRPLLKSLFHLNDRQPEGLRFECIDCLRTIRKKQRDLKKENRI